MCPSKEGYPSVCPPSRQRRVSQCSLIPLQRISVIAIAFIPILSKLQSGAGQLSTGAAQLAKGTDQMVTQLSRAVSHTPNVYHQQLVSAISNPVSLRLRQYGQINNYGQGFAPYFLSLGLYVGALLISIIVPFRDPPKQPGSGLAWFVSKLAVLGSIAVVQTLVADVVLLTDFAT